MVGEPIRNRQVVLAGNHLSYLDIEIISTVTPWSFVAKAEVASWPLFGTLARLQQTAFTSRSRSQAMNDRDTLSVMLKNGKNLIIFPEGTSSDGGDVLPFKSSLLSAAFDHGLPVQPLTIALRRINGQMADRADIRDIYAWHGDMTLPPHLWRFACATGVQVDLIFHPPIEPGSMPDRKALAKACEDAVRRGLHESISSQGWRKPEDLAKVSAIKEMNHGFYDPGSQPPADVPAEQIRQ